MFGGEGGSLLDGGGGGGGGSVTIESKDNINVSSPIDISGGSGGGMTGTGGRGGDGPIGGTGGSTGASGGGGDGGSLTVKTSKVPPNRLETIRVIFSNVANAGGGAAGVYFAQAGNGGNGSSGGGGTGGNAGNQGSGGLGGLMDVTGLNVHITSAGLLTANGGSNGVRVPGIIVPGYAGISGDGGNGSGLGSGGDGGRVGDAGSGAAGGTIRLTVPGDLTVDEGPLGSDHISARGGLVSDDKAKSGKGGTAGPGSADIYANGGKGGDIGLNGNAGRGGDILIKGGSGDLKGAGVLAVAGGKVYDMAAISGAGGNAGQFGIGGRSGNILKNGSAGEGGHIIISSSSGTIGLSNLIAPGGDVDGTFKPQTGNGGTGGSLMGNGGASGDIGDNGDGGEGGLIRETTNRGTIGVDGKVQGKLANLIAPGGVVAPIIDIEGTPISIFDVHIYAPSQAKTGARRQRGRWQRRR